MDFDPRDYGDARDRRDDDWRDRDDDVAITLGRGPSARDPQEEHTEGDPRHREDEDWRGLDRDRDSRDRDEGLDPRDVFIRDLDLPRGQDRAIVHDARERAYALRGSESRTLSTVGGFRVVSSRDLRDDTGRPTDPRSGDLRHLREEGLIRTHRLDGHRDVAVVLTKEGRDLLESCRRDHSHDHQREDRPERQQAFYAELKKPREVEHDVHVYRAYLREAERLAERGAHIERVVLDYELKREYQRWLHQRDKDRDDTDGRPDRLPAEIEEWAHDHDLPYFDEQVHFPDLCIEYELPDGRWDHVDVEVTTLHYRGAHGGAAAKSGFSTYRGASARLGGGVGGSRGGGWSGAGLAEEMLD